jgi:CheY-like chemotaxis protein
MVAMAGTRETARILVVDDERTNRALLKGSLEKHAHRVELANDGHEALEKLGVTPFDLVLLDLDMPGYTGLEVLERMKANPRLRKIPVIIVSATQELDGVVQCIEAGATDYLPKPFDPVLLETRVRSSLATKRLAEALDAGIEDESTSPLLRAHPQDGHDDETMRGIPPTDDEETRDGMGTLPPSQRGSRWDRFALLPGVELHVRESNAIPTAPEQRKVWLTALLERLRSQLEAL